MEWIGKERKGLERKGEERNGKERIGRDWMASRLSVTGHPLARGIEKRSGLDRRGGERAGQEGRELAPAGSPATAV